MAAAGEDARGPGRAGPGRSGADAVSVLNLRQTGCEK